MKNKSMKLCMFEPGKNISVVVKVLEDVSYKKVLRTKVGDETNIVNLVAWDKDKDKINFSKNDVIEIIDGVGDTTSPSILVTEKTKIVKLDVGKNIVNVCMQKHFLDEILNYHYSYVSCVISRVYGVLSYYCTKCKKISGRMCNCGSFPEPVFKVSGIISDSTKDIKFTTVSEEVARVICGVDKSKALNFNNKNLMNKVYNFFGYLYGDHFYVEQVL